MADPGGTVDIIGLARTLSGLGTPVLIVLLLYASFKGWWVWGRQLTQCEAQWTARLEKAEAEWLSRQQQEIRDKNEWKAMALRATGLAEVVAKVGDRAPANGAK